MATSTLVPLQEYLRTSYEPDCEWVDGELKERCMPDGYHGYFQGWFLDFFQRRSESLGLRALAEVRIRVSNRGYRIPDVQVIPAAAAFLPSPTVTPLICIEIISPDERVADLQQKIDDYAAMGVKAIWTVDPRRRTMCLVDAESSHKVLEFIVPGTDVSISASEGFAELDELERR